MEYQLYLNGMTYKAIAEYTNQPLGVVRSKVFAQRKRQEQADSSQE